MASRGKSPSSIGFVVDAALSWAKWVKGGKTSSSLLYSAASSSFFLASAARAKVDFEKWYSKSCRSSMNASVFAVDRGEECVAGETWVCLNGSCRGERLSGPAEMCWRSRCLRVAWALSPTAIALGVAPAGVVLRLGRGLAGDAAPLASPE